jgi:glycosyltransferase involved in cell wall biosynthesis
MTNKLVSIIIPVREINKYITNEIIPALKKQTYQNFELIIVPDKTGRKYKFPDWVKIISSWPKTGPSDKRNLGIKKSKADILAFIDDDAYPEKNWLKTAVQVFKNNPRAAGVCGPGMTPPNDSLSAKVSGWVWSTWLGAGGAGIYRCLPGNQREVDDYPTFNLFVKKKYIKKAGGFNSKFYPGEDTKLCCDLVYKFNKKIIYDPGVKVYHHRRKIFPPHLKQVSRYGRQRGLFARILPKTSNRIGYWIPPLFVIGLLTGWTTFFISKILFYTYLGFISAYIWMLILTFWQVWLLSKNLLIALLTLPSIFLTHLVYGLNFIKGYLTSK